MELTKKSLVRRDQEHSIVEIVLLTNSMRYFIKKALIVITGERQFRLLIALYQKANSDLLFTDEVYNSLKGAKIAFLKFCSRMAFDEFENEPVIIRPEWSNPYSVKLNWLYQFVSLPRIQSRDSDNYSFLNKDFSLHVEILFQIIERIEKILFNTEKLITHELIQNLFILIKIAFNEFFLNSNNGRNKKTRFSTELKNIVDRIKILKIKLEINNILSRDVLDVQFHLSAILKSLSKNNT